MRKIFTSSESLSILAIVFGNYSIIVAKHCDVQTWLNFNLFKRTSTTSE
ncbi:hypothetical protein [Chryseobacterium artocarpi]